MRRLLDRLGRRAEEPTTSAGWEAYARAFDRRRGHLGDEWNLPDVLGIDVAPGEIVPTIDRLHVAPFLGACDAILEIGPGGGRWTTILLPKCRRLVAADTSRTMLDMVRARFAGDPRLECLHLDGHGLGPVADASVDAVFSFDVFVHLPQWDVFQYLRETARVLRPGGKAVIHHGNVFSELGWRNFLDEVPYTVGRHKPYGNFAVMTPELMRGFAERAGLVVEACRTDIVRRDAITFAHKPAARPD
jgi:SAM-dependent methyltransferase